jgi:medium-chain acyl-[acyl-carrier-protein] hydrolase
MTTTSGDMRPGTSRATWFAWRANQGARQWLLCFPHAGAGATAFAPWQQLLPPGIGLQAVQPPGREGRLFDPPYRDARSFARDILPSVAVLADRPVILFGHSVGAIMAFELARAIRRAGLPPPAHLYVSGRTAPHIAPTGPVMWNLTDDELVAQLRALGGTPAAVLRSPELLALFLPALRADLVMNELYECADEGVLDIPITAFAAARDERAEPGQVAEWASHTTGRFTLAPVAGGHFTVMTQPRIVIDRLVDDTGESR